MFYDKHAKAPTYYTQQGIRNGKKQQPKTSEHSELLKITDDPLTYVKEEIKKMNEDYRVGKVTFDLTADFNESVWHSDNETSSST